MTAKRAVIALTAVILIQTSFVIFAQTEPGETVQPKKSAPLEFLGLGPEMFENRMVAWIKAFGVVAKEMVSEIGVLAAAVILLYQNLKQRRQLGDTEELKKSVENVEAQNVRLSERVHNTALATEPPKVHSDTPAGESASPIPAEASETPAETKP